MTVIRREKIMLDSISGRKLFSFDVFIFLINSYLKKAQVKFYLKIVLNLNASIERIEINKFWKICWDFKTKNQNFTRQTEFDVFFF